MNKSDIQRFCNYKIYSRDPKKYSVRGFVNIDDGSLGGLIGLVSKLKITNPFVLTRLVLNQINFY